MGLGERLRHERERLHLSQDAFAALVGKSRKSQIRWEQDESAPGIDALAIWAANGVDVGFVLTGQPSQPIAASFEDRLKAFSDANELARQLGMPELRDGLYLSREQATLLANFAQCGVEDQIAILRLAEAAANRRPMQSAVHEPPATYAGKTRKPAGN